MDELSLTDAGHILGCPAERASVLLEDRGLLASGRVTASRGELEALAMEHLDPWAHDPNSYWLTTGQAARFLRVPVRRVRAWIKDGLLRSLTHSDPSSPPMLRRTDVEAIANGSGQVPDRPDAAEDARLRHAAAAGDPDAICRLGEVFLDRGDPDEVGRIEGLWRRAASAGHPVAMLHLADLLRDLYEEREDAGDEDLDPEDDHMTWYERAATKGNVEAMMALAWELEFYGDDEPETLAEARHWWRTAAEAGNSIAMANLGTSLNDASEKERWYRRAAAEGETSAMYNLGSLLTSLDDTASAAEGQAWWRRAAAAGDRGVMRLLARSLRDRGDPESLREAAAWEQRAADEDEPPEVSIAAASRILACDKDAARRILAAHGFLAGARVTATWEELEDLAMDLDPPRDQAGGRTSHWITPEQAAEVLDTSVTTVERLLDMGRLPYRTHRASGARLLGRGQVEELATARRHFPRLDGASDAGTAADMDPAPTEGRRSGDLGDATTMYQLGLRHEQRDEGYPGEQAEAWYRRAAVAGHPAAMTRLGHLIRMYEPDSDEASTWFRRAAELGDIDAMRQLRQEPSTSEEYQAWTQHLAESGDVEAMVAMGFSALREDTDAAMSWWRRAAATGDPDAMYVMGRALQECGRATEAAEALMWLRRAAAAGQPDAIADLHNTSVPADDPDTDGATSDPQPDQPPR